MNTVTQSGDAARTDGASGLSGRSPYLHRSASLLLQLMLLAALNAALVLGAAMYAVPHWFGVGWQPLLTADIRDRVQGIAEAIAAQVGPVLGKGWRIDLERFGDLYGVEFSVYDGQGNYLAGADPGLPADVKQELLRTRALLMSGAGTGAPAASAVRLAAGELPGWPVPDRALLMRWMFVLPDEVSHRYWAGTRTAVVAADGGLIPVAVVANTPSFWRMARFLDLREWVTACVALLSLSVLMWLPFIWRLTWHMRRLIAATRRVGDGHFDTRIELPRRDELGLLARSVNRVAVRLDHFLNSQKHFLANIAHEVLSPLMRLQMSLALLRNHLRHDGEAAYRDVEEEVELMTELLNELLAFSRVGIGAQGPPLTTVSLFSLVVAVLQREKNARDKVVTSVPRDLRIRTNVGILNRALGNLVRNAIRYAGTDKGPIEIDVTTTAKTVVIQVSDRGPGVPELALLKLGDPFYRPENARQRTTGGLGLGLATVRNCVAACGGTVVFRNRPGGGFQAEIVLPHADF